MKRNFLLVEEEESKENQSYALFPHQTAFYPKLLKSKRLILNHPTGSGKTLTALAAFTFLRNSKRVSKMLVIVPASLKLNFIENIAKFDFQYSWVVVESQNDFFKIGDIYITSYTFAAQNMEMFQHIPYDFVVLDELQKVKNRRSVGYASIENILNRGTYVLALSASVTNNSPEEFLALFDLISGKPLSKRVKNLIFPIQQKILSRVFWKKRKAPKVDYSQPSIRITSPEKFRDILSPHFDYVDPKDIEKQIGRPQEVIHYVDVPLTAEHSALYLKALDQIGKKYLQNFYKGAIHDRDFTSFFMKLAAARQTLIDPSFMMRQRDIYALMDTGKLGQLLRDVQHILSENPKHRILVFSTFVGFGIHAISTILASNGIKNLAFTGGLSSREKGKIIQDFRGGEYPVLLLSQAGAEGLDFPFVSHVIILDPHWNPEVMRQMRSRGVRSGGTSYWKQVHIYIYKAKLASVGLKKRLTFGVVSGNTDTVDDWILAVSLRKTRNNVLLKQALTGLPKKGITETMDSIL